MTEKNREAAYKHYRDLENTYEAAPHLDSNITSTESVRARSKESADALLKKYPELEVKEEVKEPEQIEEEPVEEKKTKSKGKK